VTILTYRAIAERHGSKWRIHVPGIDQRAHAFTMADIEVVARSLIARFLDIPMYSFSVEVELQRRPA